jgi:hypothetical protein
MVVSASWRESNHIVVEERVQMFTPELEDGSPRGDCSISRWIIKKTGVAPPTPAS